MAGFGVMLVDTPSPTNSIYLDQNGASVINYELSTADKVRMADAVADAVKVMFAAGAKRVIIPSSEPIIPGIGNATTATYFEHPHDAEAIRSNLKFAPNRTILTSAHLQASNKMSVRPDQGVVGPDFRVWGYDNLYVCDSSVFPTSVGANPMQTIYTFAKIFADKFIQKHRNRN